MELGRIEPASEVRPVSRAGALRRIWGKVARDPLFHFMVLGTLLFAAALLWQHLNDPRRIAIGQSVADRIAADYRYRFGEAPTPEALRAALLDYAEDEVLFREGVAQGIDRDDEIVRRRIIQKMRFLIEDASPGEAPSEATLRAYYAANPDRYRTPVRISFHHVYFATEAGEELARIRAESALGALKRGEAGAADSGDPFPDRAVFTGLTQSGVQRLFGKSPFADRLFALPAGRWSEPLRSGMGWHLVHVDGKTPARLEAFDAARERVAADWSEAEQDARSRQALERLTKRYTIVMPDGLAAP